MTRKNARSAKADFVELDELDRPPPDPESVKGAEELEARIAAKKRQQLQRLKHESCAVYGLMEGNPGLQKAEKWAELLEEAGDQVGNGHFLVRMLGAERYLDPRTVAVLLTLRQNLMADLPNAGAADVMLIDLAVIAYYNVLRVQGWIGNLSLNIEADLFGRETHNDAVGDQISKQASQLSEVFLPLQEKSSKAMVRSLAELRLSGSRPRKSSKTKIFSR